ncbi:DUF1214 domain-containing protein [Gilvimarinus xylanilyticus]|uniref:DUF1214 domain-containing protein n=1 Tax=Gilvimarinus xylanilyticus TaxID=2944139 RepID=A0A9X2KTP4_9GAMM|nr:DUF1214 domain-containing protein [Gilvimarinus xylanilyticus]MCP8899504.1 DUF1214 domain-containing protein [Gilvimarinus xylanilyticus]
MKTLLGVTTALLGAVFLSACEPSGDATQNQPQASSASSSPASISDQDIINSYVYLLSRALVVRQEQIDFNNTGLEYNTIKYNEAGKADFVNPNLDVAYMESWIAIDENSAVILSIPEVQNRYYTAQFLDGWGEVITNINERNYPDHPYGDFALCLKPCQVDLPEGAYLIEVPNKKIKMLARVELQDDLQGAIDLQQEFTLRTLGNPDIEPTLDFPGFTNQALPKSNLFSYTEAFIRTPDSMMPNATELQSIARELGDYVAQSQENAERVDRVIGEQAIPQFMQFATTKAGKFANGWLATLTAGNYNGDYWTRTSANFVGIWANTSAEVIYFIAAKDAAGQALVGGKAYRLHFSKDNLPEKNVNSFWSVILVDFPGYKVVDNALNRYNFNNYSEFSYNDDGSLTLYVAPEYNPEWPKSNWLPSPKQQAFNLTLRMYVPKDNVLQGDWFPPALTAIAAH